MLFLFSLIWINISFGYNINYNIPRYSNGSCNATASTNNTCANAHNFAVYINGTCEPSDVSQNCWFIYNCICNGTVNGYQFKGYKNDKCLGESVALHTLPIDTCTADHGACDGSNTPFDGYYAYFTRNEFLKCCPECANNVTLTS